MNIIKRVKLFKIVIVTLLVLALIILAKNEFKHSNKELPKIILKIITKDIINYFKKESSIADEKLKKELLDKELIVGEENYATLLRYNLVKKSYSPDQIDEYLRQEGFDFRQENKKAILDSLAKLYDKNTNIDDHLKIPTITHRVYFSSPKNPKELSTLYIEMIKASLNKLNSINDTWQHNLWTNNTELFPSVHDIKVNISSSPSNLASAV
jgi:hypothetical protein